MTHVITNLSSRQLFESSLSSIDSSKLSPNVKIVRIDWVSECLRAGRLLEPQLHHLLVDDRVPIVTCPATTSNAISSYASPSLSNPTSSANASPSVALSQQLSDHSDLEDDLDNEPDPGADPAVSYPSNVPAYGCERRSPYDCPDKKIIDALETLIDFCHFQQG